MTVYFEMVVLLNFLVDYFLLLGTNRLCGYPPGWRRAVWGALLGAVYGGICLLPGFSFMGNTLWQIVFLLGIGIVSFGFSMSAVRRSLIFVLLSTALGGIASGLDNHGIGGLLFAAAGLCALCIFGFRNKPGGIQYIPVELQYGEKHIRLTALHDTGNSLTDPVTGRPVLVVCGEIARKLTGLTIRELSEPVDTLAKGVVPGLRLVPYQSVGQPCGLLLALRIPNVKIGTWEGSSLVAFAPERLSREGEYEALTGGVA